MQRRTTEPRRTNMSVELEGLEPRMCLTANGSLALPPEPTTLGTASAESVVAADFDRDGLNDLVSARGNVLSYFRGRSDGTFAPAVQTTLPTEVGQLAVGRFDGNQAPDLAALSRVRGTGAGTGYVGLLARVLYFDGGTQKFLVGARLRLGDAAAALGERRIGTGDFISGWRDEIVVGIGSHVDMRLLNVPMRTELVQREVLLQNNQATLLAMTVATGLPGLSSGRPQVVSVIEESFSNTVVITRKSADSALFHDTRSVASFATARYGSVVVGDVDNDGDQDILLGGRDSNRPATAGEVVVLRGNAGAFLPAEVLVTSRLIEYYQSARMQVDGLADINGDGRMDVVYHTIIHTDYRLVYTEFQPAVGVQNVDGTFTEFATGRSVTSPVYWPYSYSRAVVTTVGSLSRPAVVQYSDQASLSIGVATTEKFGPIVRDPSAAYTVAPNGGSLRTGTAYAYAVDRDGMRGGRVVRVEIFVDLDGNGIDASDPLLSALTTQNSMYPYSWSGEFTVPNEWAAGNYAMYARAIDDDGLMSEWTSRPFQVYA